MIVEIAVPKGSRDSGDSRNSGKNKGIRERGSQAFGDLLATVTLRNLHRTTMLHMVQICCATIMQGNVCEGRRRKW